MSEKKRVERRDPPNGTGYHILVPGPGRYPLESAKVLGPFCDLREAIKAQPPTPPRSER